MNPLMVQKTDKRGGTIVASPAAQAAAAAAVAEAMPPPKKAKVTLFLNLSTTPVPPQGHTKPGLLRLLPSAEHQQHLTEHSY